MRHVDSNLIPRCERQDSAVGETVHFHERAVERQSIRCAHRHRSVAEPEGGGAVGARVGHQLHAAASGKLPVVAVQTGPVLVDLHAKLMLPDADVRDVHAALAIDDGRSWSVVDTADGSLRSAGPTRDDRLSVMVRRRPADTAR